MTQNEEGSIKSRPEASWIAGGSLQILNMRGVHLAFTLIAAWVGCCLTVGFSLYFGWLWGHSSGLVDGHRETAERITTLMKANHIPAELFEQQLKALADRKPAQAPDVSTFVVLPGDKAATPQVIQVKSEPAELPENLNVTIKNIKELLPKAVKPAEKPEVPKAPEVPKEPKKAGDAPKPEASKSVDEDGTVSLPALGETQEWLKAREAK